MLTVATFRNKSMTKLTRRFVFRRSADNVESKTKAGRFRHDYLRRHNIVICYVEQDPFCQPKVDACFKAIIARGDALVASDAARFECLVGPFQSGDTAVANDYHKFFDPKNGIQTLQVTSAVWERAAEIRALFRLQPLDSIHCLSN
jgi:hypothetical protein